MKEKTEIKYEILNFYAKVSREGKTLEEYGLRKLLNEIYEYARNL